MPMIPPFRRPPRAFTPLGITLIYLVGGSAWIIGSDLYFIGPESPAFVTELLKGSTFIVVTALILWLLMRRGTRALRLSEAQARLLLDEVPDAVATIDLAGRVLAANRRAGELCGCAVDQLLGRDVREFIAPESLAAQPLQWDRLVTDELVTSRRPIVRADGSRVEVEIHARRFLPDRVQVSIRDVAARAALEAQQRQAQKMEAVGQLTGGIAHDLNNVFTAILGSVDLLLEEHAGLPGPRSELAELRQSARRGAAMVRKLLAFSRRGTAELVPVDLGEVVRELAVTLRRLLPPAIDFRLDVPERALVAVADAGGIEQLVVNLVTNARDAMADGGRLRIAVDGVDVAAPPPGSAAAPGTFICLSVSDTGVGMDEATLRRIFEPFFTTKPAGIGTGLGMPVVEGLVRQHHGFLTVESTPGHGTTVTIHIPAADVAVRPLERHRTLDPPRGSETILLVDDEDAIRRVGERLLVMLGYQVITARDGEEGLERWRQDRDRIALVVSDLVMPRRGGRELYEAIVAEAPAARFLFTSGYDPEEMDALQRVLPGVPILDKPWPAAALAQAVRHAIDRPPPRAPAA